MNNLVHRTFKFMPETIEFIKVIKRATGMPDDASAVRYAIVKTAHRLILSKPKIHVETH